MMTETEGADAGIKGRLYGAARSESIDAEAVVARIVAVSSRRLHDFLPLPASALELRTARDTTHRAPRRHEPVTAGIPLPQGLVRETDTAMFAAPTGQPRPLQAHVTDRWPDGSARWMLLDLHVDRAPDQAVVGYLTGAGQQPRPTPDNGVSVHEAADGIRVRSGTAEFSFLHGAAFPLSSVTLDGHDVCSPAQSGLEVTIDSTAWRYVIRDVEVRHRGPLRVELWLRAMTSSPSTGTPVEAFARVDLFAGVPAAKIEVTLRNPHRAEHPGGQWSLGDPGSVLIESAVVGLQLTAPLTALTCSPETGAPHEPFGMPFLIHQESSGGEHWNAPVHRNRDDRVPLRFQGYQLQSGDTRREGRRATPVVVVETAHGQVSATMPRFWENFPRSIRVETDRIQFGLFPPLDGELHELQGGEQKTHGMVICFGADPVGGAPLEWCHDPTVLHLDPAQACASAGFPFLLPAAEDPSPAYLRLIDLALDDTHGFLAKRERADEFGWRHFGDLPADHESAFQPPDQPFVSHYNNQYDPIAGFGLHFLRTGDRRWWQLMVDLAAHVRDIDTYHTTEDKATYNGGLFWHTNHYVDAGLSTHRTYPKGGTDSGGPSAEHNYNTGLMLHYFLTGDDRSRDAAIAFGQWVLDMDDPRRTPLRWLSLSPTGWASYTAGHHKPGRGAGHSILACLVAHRLSGERRFLDKAEELIRRCIGPGEAVPAMYVDDVEGYWSYTAFLQALGAYLHHKVERGETDSMTGWARAGLLSFARFMADHERPYLERRERLQFPTQTWAAQDLRKADVFLWAALQTQGAERERFLERADAFFDYATTELPRLDGCSFTRPLVLVMTQGVRYGWFTRHRGELPPPVPLPPPPADIARRPFRSQRDQAVRRAGALAAAAAAVAITLTVVVWWMVS
jgi:hypothetical protein